MNENTALAKLYWPDIRERVAHLDPVFSQIVDNLNVDKHFPIYLAQYPYGSFIADTQSPFLPVGDGTVRRLIRFNYFHNEEDRHRIVNPSSEITKFDPRFNHVSSGHCAKDAVFALDARFLRGCVSLQSIN